VDLSGVGRVLLIIAVVMAAAGVVFLLAGRGVIPRLPGDISFSRGNTRFYFPLGTSILISVVLTVVLNMFLRR
jgi:Protein of unknown function (DUF2905)